MSQPQRRSALDWIEWAGNKLPEPALIFVILAVIVIAVAAVGDAMGWQVTPVQPRVVMQPVVDAAGAPVLDAAGKPLTAPAKDEAGRVVTELVATGAPIDEVAESLGIMTREQVDALLVPEKLTEPLRPAS